MLTSSVNHQINAVIRVNIPFDAVLTDVAMNDCSIISGILNFTIVVVTVITIDIDNITQ